MTVTTTNSRLTTYDDYRHLPDDGKQHQIIEGQLYITPAPSPYHQEVLLNIASPLREFIQKNNLGKLYTSPIDVILSMTDVVQPDLVFISQERINIITKKNIVDAPDLVVEILSEHNESIDRTKKMSLYERHGVKEYWIVDPSAKSVEQFLLNNSALSLKDTYKDDQNLACVVVNSFTFSPSDIF